MKILVVGGGGREHVLAWKLQQSPRVSRLFCAPGNAGIASIAECVPLGAGQVDELTAFAVREAIDLTVVGPEAPLAAGLVDRLQAAGRRAFGPTAAAAQIECDKSFSKELMRRNGVPTAAFARFRQPDAALAYLDRLEAEGVASVVVKASGLAAGKGAIVAETMDQARAAVHRMMVERVFGAAGDEVLIEERLVGEEASLLALCHRETVVPLIPAQDYKRALDGDRGLNTGGMGAYAPAPVISETRYAEVLRRAIRPTLAALAKAGTPYVGCLYTGVMLTGEGMRVIEFNARFGDPETQAVLPLLETDLLELMLATTEGRLEVAQLTWRPEKAVSVVMAAPGYPDEYPRGLPIEGLAEAASDPRALLFHAGTAARDGRIVTDGGRVLTVTGLGATFDEAAGAAYRAAERVHFDGAHFRRDIARKLLG